MREFWIIFFSLLCGWCYEWPVIENRASGKVIRFWPVYLMIAIVIACTGCNIPHQSPIELEMQRTGRLTPEIINEAQQWFNHDLRKVSVSVSKKHDAAKELSARSPRPLYWVRRRDGVLCIVPGSINSGHRNAMNTNLFEAGGFATFCHELKHCEQFAHGVDLIWRGHDSPHELEAIELQKRVSSYYERHEDELSRFKGNE